MKKYLKQIKYFPSSRGDKGKGKIKIEKPKTSREIKDIFK